MTQLNSTFLTALQRRYLPVIFSLVLLGALGAILAPPIPSWSVIGIAVAVVASVALAYFSVYRVLVYPAADRVVLDGDVLRVTKRGRESSVPAASIVSIRDNAWISPETITLHLAAGCELGGTITFIPPARFPSAQEHPVLAPLRASMQSA